MLPALVVWALGCAHSTPDRSPLSVRLEGALEVAANLEEAPRWALPALIRLHRLAWRRQLKPEGVDEARYALAVGPPAETRAPVA